MTRLGFEHPWFLVLLVALPAVLLVLRFTLVDSPRVQLAVSAATRCLILLLLALALGSLLWVSFSGKLSVVILGDLSDSVPESAPVQLSNRWQQSSAQLPGHAQGALTTFAVTNEAVSGLGRGGKLQHPITKPTQASATAVERALLNAW